MNKILHIVFFLSLFSVISSRPRGGDVGPRRDGPRRGGKNDDRERGSSYNRIKRDVYAWKRSLPEAGDVTVDELIMFYKDIQAARFYSTDKMLFRVPSVMPSFTLYDYTQGKTTVVLKPFFTTNICLLVTTSLSDYANFLAEAKNRDLSEEDVELTATETLFTGRRPISQTDRLPVKVQEFCKDRNIYKTFTEDPGKLSDDEKKEETYLLFDKSVTVTFPAAEVKPPGGFGDKKKGGKKGPFFFPPSEDFSEPDPEDDNVEMWNRVIDTEENVKAKEFSVTNDDNDQLQIYSMDEALTQNEIAQSTSFYDFADGASDLAVKIKDTNICIVISSPVPSTASDLITEITDNANNSPVTKDEIERITATLDLVDEAADAGLSDEVQEFCQYKTIIHAQTVTGEFGDLADNEEVRTVLLPSVRLEIKTEKSIRNRPNAFWWTNVVDSDDNLESMIYNSGNRDVFYYKSNDPKLEDFSLKPSKATYDFLSGTAEVALEVGGVCLILDTPTEMTYDEALAEANNRKGRTRIDVGSPSDARSITISSAGPISESERGQLSPMVQETCQDKDIYKAGLSGCFSDVGVVVVDANNKDECESACSDLDSCEFYKFVNVDNCRLYSKDTTLDGFSETAFTVRNCNTGGSTESSTFLLFNEYVEITYPAGLLDFTQGFYPPLDAPQNPGDKDDRKGRRKDRRKDRRGGGN